MVSRVCARFHSEGSTVPMFPVLLDIRFLNYTVSYTYQRQDYNELIRNFKNKLLSSLFQKDACIFLTYTTLDHLWSGPLISSSSHPSHIPGPHFILLGIMSSYSSRAAESLTLSSYTRQWPGCPAPGWREGWDSWQLLPCSSRETLPLLVPILWSPWPCSGLTHRWISGATSQTKSHNLKVFLKHGVCDTWCCPES